MGVFTNHAKVLKHACPTCEAEPGEQCRGISGMHDARWNIVFPHHPVATVFRGKE